VRQGGKAESNKLAVRVHEVDGAHDHLLDLEEDLYGTDLPCYSRLRKNRRKKGQPGEGPEVMPLSHRTTAPLHRSLLTPPRPM
jgi:hypothetical protein